MAKSNKTGITRRDVIKGAGALAGAAIGTGAITGFGIVKLTRATRQEDG